MTFSDRSLRLSLTLLIVVFVGCTTESDPDHTEETIPRQPAVGGHHHPDHGPHHGDLIELGAEEYHAEVVHDESAGSVTVYVLDAAAATQVPIDATEITINTTHDGTPAQFQLAASPDVGDPPGRSSRFISGDAELAAHLDEEGTSPRLVLAINGKSYRGRILHDHGGHAHGTDEHVHQPR